MRRSLVLTILLALAAGAALPACSALGLDHLPQADCTVGGGGLSGDAYCASLATLVPVSDSCHTWQCNTETLHCEQQLRDADGDGYSPMECAQGGPIDCDDAHADVHPTATETCDGRDQNCDGIPDDGVIAPAASAEASLTTITGDPQVTMTYQPDADQALVIAGYSPPRFDAITIEATATPVDLSFHQGTTTIAPITPQLAIEGLGGMNYALAARLSPAGCQQWGLFPVAAGASTISMRATDHYLLPACPNAGITAVAVAGVHSDLVNGDLLAVAWLSGIDDARECGAAPARDVIVSAAAFTYGSLGANAVSNDVVTLGQSVGNGPPIVAAVGDAFVVAYPRADATIAVHLVTISADTGGIHVSPSTAMPTPDYTEPAATAVPQDVRIAVAPTTTGGSTTFALGWITDCTATNSITTRLITRHGTAFTPATPTTNLGSGRGRSHLTLAYQPRVAEWLLAWRSSLGQSAQRLHDDGTVKGDAFDLRPMHGVAEYTVEPLASGSLYRAIVRDGTTLSQIPFGCAP